MSSRRDAASNRFVLILALAIGIGTCTAFSDKIKPMYVRKVRFDGISLHKGERISAIEVTVMNACVSKVTIPLHWRAEVGWPDATCGTMVTAEASHGVAWVNDGDEFGNFLTLAFYKEWGGHDRFDKDRDIIAKIVIEDEDPPRTNTLPAGCIRVSEPWHEEN